MKLDIEWESPRYFSEEQGIQRLYSMGSKDRKIYVVRDGVVLEKYPIENGCGISFANCKGDFFGLDALFSEERKAEAVVYPPAILEQVSVRRLLEYLKHSTEYARFLGYVARRLSDDRTTVSHLVYDKIENNFMRLVEYLVANSPVDGIGRSIIPSNDLSECIAITPETFSRTKRTLADRGLVEKGRGLRLNGKR